MKTIDFEVTLENYSNDIRKLYGILRPAADPDAIRCKDFDVGIMNRVVKMDDPSSKYAIVFRISRMKILEAMSPEEREEDKSRPSLANRELELEAVRRASELGITVKLCAIFRNGFVYRFVDGDMLTFENYDAEIASRTAASVAKLHRMDLGAMAREKPAILWNLGRDRDQAEVQQERAFYDQKMKEGGLVEPCGRLPSFTKICAELESVHEILVAKDAYGPICFCHNDLNVTNWLVERDSKRRPVLLDFEWANTNYQMYDIANHLLSICHVLGDFFHPGIPSEEFIKHWLRSYYEEASGGGQTPGEQFEAFIDNELKKVLASMLLLRLLMVKFALQFTLKYTGQLPIQQGIEYACKVYDDYRENRDKHLRLLDTLKKF